MATILDHTKSHAVTRKTARRGVRVIGRVKSWVSPFRGNPDHTTTRAPNSKNENRQPAFTPALDATDVSQNLEPVPECLIRKPKPKTKRTGSAKMRRLLFDAFKP